MISSDPCDVSWSKVCCASVCCASVCCASIRDDVYFSELSDLNPHPDTCGPLLMAHNTSPVVARRWRGISVTFHLLHLLVSDESTLLDKRQADPFDVQVWTCPLSSNSTPITHSHY